MRAGDRSSTLSTAAISRASGEGGGGGAGAGAGAGVGTGDAGDAAGSRAADPADVISVTGGGDFTSVGRADGVRGSGGATPRDEGDDAAARPDAGPVTRTGGGAVTRAGGVSARPRDAPARGGAGSVPSASDVAPPRTGGSVLAGPVGGVAACDVNTVGAAGGGGTIGRA